MNRLAFENAYTVVHLDGGEAVTAKCLLIATGADYRRLAVEGSDRFEGTGVYYAATLAEAQLCRDSQVVVVGGGNSAGQGAVFLSGYARRVLLLIRGDDLYKNMSSYLARRIEQTSNIELVRNTTIRRMTATRTLELWTSSTARPGKCGPRRRRGYSVSSRGPEDHLAAAGNRKRCEGFFRTGTDVARSRSWEFRARAVSAGDEPPGRVRGRGTCGPGLLSALPSPVGEGAMAVQFVHECLRHM